MFLFIELDLSQNDRSPTAPQSDAQEVYTLMKLHAVLKGIVWIRWMSLSVSYLCVLLLLSR